MHNKMLDGGVNKLKEVLNALSLKLDEPINAAQLEGALKSMDQVVDDGEEQDIELSLKLGGKEMELIVKSAVIHNEGPFIHLNTESEALADLVAASC